MSTPKKRTARDELEAIEDAFIQSILDADGQALREEYAALCLNPDDVITAISSTIDSAKSLYARQQLEKAKTELVAFRSKNREFTSSERQAARGRFERARTGDRELSSKLMMAARKGEGLSDADFDSVVEDFAMLDRLEGEGEEP
jgi:hypothetical protein